MSAQEPQETGEILREGTSEIQRDGGVDVLCPECGEIIHIADVLSFVRSIHLQQACVSMEGLLR